MARVHTGRGGFYSHRAAPFQEVVNALQPERNLSYSPLFQVLLNWREATAEPQFIGFPELTVEPLLAQANISKFDLTLFVTDMSPRTFCSRSNSTLICLTKTESSA